MNASMAESRFEGPRDRRKHLRRSSDREIRNRLAELTELTREKGCCAEIGCEASAWPGSEFCIWHPKLRLTRQTEIGRSRSSMQIRL